MVLLLQRVRLPGTKQMLRQEPGCEIVITAGMHPVVDGHFTPEIHRLQRSAGHSGRSPGPVHLLLAFQIKRGEGTSGSKGFPHLLHRLQEQLVAIMPCCCGLPPAAEIRPVLCAIDGHVLVPAVNQQPVRVQELICHGGNKIRNPRLEHQLVIVPGNAERIILDAADMADILKNPCFSARQHTGNESLVLQQKPSGLLLAE
ncbi:hypothetical protein D3C80_1274430 [compost metagenome]